jgi:hypothetical protein
MDLLKMLREDTTVRAKWACSSRLIYTAAHNNVKMRPLGWTSIPKYTTLTLVTEGITQAWFETYEGKKVNPRSGETVW